MTSTEVIKFLEQAGWKPVRTQSTHKTFKHPGNPLLVTIPHPRKDLKTGTLRQIERITGLALK